MRPILFQGLQGTTPVMKAYGGHSIFQLSRRITSRLVITGLCLLAAACGGGGGNDTVAPDGNGNPGGNGTTLNAGVSGTLFLAGSGSMKEMDLATGIQRTVRPGTASSVSVDGSTLIFAGEDSRNANIGGISEELAWVGRDGRTIRFFVKQGSMSNAAISPDNSLVAVRWPSVGASNIVIFDRNGDMQHELSVAARDWTWMPDGRLLYGTDDAIFLTSSDYQSRSLVASFPGEKPRDLSLSPAGDQLAFVLDNLDAIEGTNYHVWLMDLDADGTGSNARQITVSSFNEGSPAWSPDGQKIAFRYGITRLAGPCPTVHIVNANVDSPVDPTQSNAALLTLRQRTTDGAFRDDTCAFSGLHWRAVLPQAAPEVNTPLPSDGFNAGLTGSLLFGNISRAVLMNLATGEGQLLSDDAAGLSRDAQEIAYREDAPSVFQNEDFVNVRDRADNEILSIGFAESLYRHVDFSADNQLMLVDWWGNRESGQLAPVPTVFNRSGDVLRRFFGWNYYAWMPDGRVALSDWDGISLTTDEYRNAALAIPTSDPVGKIAPSPDGSRIAFSMRGHIWTIGSDGTGLTRLTQSAATEDNPQWSADGRAILLTHDDPRESFATAWAVPADASNVWVGHGAIQSAARAIQWNYPDRGIRQVTHQGSEFVLR